MRRTILAVMGITALVMTLAACAGEDTIIEKIVTVEVVKEVVVEVEKIVTVEVEKIRWQARPSARSPRCSIRIPGSSSWTSSPSSTTSRGSRRTTRRGSGGCARSH